MHFKELILNPGLQKSLRNLIFSYLTYSGMVSLEMSSTLFAFTSSHSLMKHNQNCTSDKKTSKIRHSCMRKMNQHKLLLAVYF